MVGQVRVDRNGLKGEIRGNEPGGEEEDGDDMPCQPAVEGSNGPWANEASSEALEVNAVARSCGFFLAKVGGNGDLVQDADNRTALRL